LRAIAIFDVIFDIFNQQEKAVEAFFNKNAIKDYEFHFDYTHQHHHQLIISSCRDKK